MMKASGWNRNPFSVLLLILWVVSACGGSHGDLVRFQNQHFDQADVLRVAATIPDDLETPSSASDWVVGQLVLEALAETEVLDKDVQAAILKTDKRVSLRKCIAGKLGLRHAGTNIEAEARQLYDADPESFDVPERAELQMIFIPAERANANAIAKEILNAPKRWSKAWAKR